MIFSYKDGIENRSTTVFSYEKTVREVRFQLIKKRIHDGLKEFTLLVQDQYFRS